MYSVLLLAAAILATITVSSTGTSADSSIKHRQSYGDTESDMIPTFICGMVVNVDKKTFEDIQKHEQNQADSCKIKRLDPDDSVLATPEDTSDIV